MYGDQFPLYFPECVAQLPLSGKDHIVVSSNLNFSGASLIKVQSNEQLIGQLKNVIIDSYDEMLIGRVV